MSLLPKISIIDNWIFVHIETCLSIPHQNPKSTRYFFTQAWVIEKPNPCLVFVQFRNRNHSLITIFPFLSSSFLPSFLPQMLHSHSHHHHLLFSSLPLRLSLTTTHHNSSLPSLHFLHRPIITTTTTTTTVSAIPPTAAWLAKLTTQDFAHFELPSSHLFTDDPSTIQVACSVLLTGAITVFFFRSVQRRAKRAKELVYSLSFFLRGV